jgi:hypothetical protein
VSTTDILACKTKQGATSIVKFGWQISIILMKAIFTNNVLGKILFIYHFVSLYSVAIYCMLIIEDVHRGTRNTFASAVHVKRTQQKMSKFVKIVKIQNPKHSKSEKATSN